MEWSLQVQVHDLVPALFGKVFEIRHPAGAGVVHQDMQLRFPSTDFRRQFQYAFEGPQVVRDGDALTGLGQLGGRLLNDTRMARGDIDAHAGAHQRLGDHAADAPGAAGYQGDAAGQVE